MLSCANHRQTVAYVLSFKYIVFLSIFAKYCIAEHPNIRKIQKSVLMMPCQRLRHGQTPVVLAVSSFVTRELPASQTQWGIEIISIVPTDFESKPQNLQRNKQVVRHSIFLPVTSSRLQKVIAIDSCSGHQLKCCSL